MLCGFFSSFCVCDTFPFVVLLFSLFCTLCAVDPGHTLDKSLANARKTVAQTPLPSSVPVSSGVVMRREPLVDEVVVLFFLHY